MTTLTGYGGVGEIGGNAFLLDDGRSRIFLDLGKRFGNDPKEGGGHPGWNDFYDDFLQPRGASLATDLMRLDVVPNLPTLWRQDRGGAPGPRPVDAVLVSHAHMDHCGLLGLLRPDVPVLASAGSQATLRSLQETGSGVMSEYLTQRPKGILPKKDGSPGKGTTWKDPDGEPVQAHRPVSADAAEIGDWKLRHYDVDHSIHGARATILEGPLTIAYTGDFRMHGRDADATKRFLAKAGGVDVLITEGTNVGSHHSHENTDKEVDVEGEIEGMLDQFGDGFVGISFPPRDLDRFLSVWNVARSSNRRVVIPTKMAHLLDSVRATDPALPDPRRDSHIAIHVPVRGRGVRAMPPGTLRMPTEELAVNEIQVDDQTWTEFWLADHASWEHPYLLCDNTVTSAGVAAQPHEFLFSISYWTIGELFDIFPHDGNPPPGGLYIHSMTQPFNDEMEISDRKLQRWLKAFRLERGSTHVSGHLSEENVHWVIEQLKPGKLVPIHSQAPDVTAAKYEQRTGHKAIIPSFAHPASLL